MTKKELQQRLIKENISTFHYSLNGGLPNEAHCITQNGDIWEVYYSERGIKSSLKIFNNEEEACDYFYGWLTRTLKSMGLI